MRHLDVQFIQAALLLLALVLSWPCGLPLSDPGHGSTFAAAIVRGQEHAASMSALCESQ
jgi:hypothetical protein